MRKSRHSPLKKKSKEKKRSKERRSEGTPEDHAKGTRPPSVTRANFRKLLLSGRKVKDRDKQSAGGSHEKKRKSDESRQENAPNVSTEQDSAPTESNPTQPSSNFKPPSQPFQSLSSKPEYVESTLGYRAMHAAHKEGLIMNPRKIIHMGNIDTIQRQRRMEGRKDDIDAELDRVIREQDTEDDSTQSNAYNVTFNDIGILYTTLPDQTDDDLTPESEEHVDFH
ncbi:hypothetical protein WR25_20009 [Diploscapter pachys]|uniref:Uncharacterized protein n=1 Tax=Diploscapter pachys TaxID=2018661 RepID=A0A2A2LDZ2_9BILA|nr:hypothetical protein WR25_20009 [Diploscapter pachys]